MMLNFSLSCFQKPKNDSSESECEDCYAYDNNNNLTFAIADSVSNDSYSSKWAKLLVEDYKQFGNVDFENRMPSLQKKWHAAINWTALSDWEKDRALRGDSATLLGVSFHPQCSTLGTWDAISIGDSCLFQIRAGSLVHSFPIVKSCEFSPIVDSLCSTDLDIRTAVSRVQRLSGDFRMGDIFILATDAVAKWFITGCEADKKLYLSLEKLAACGRLHDLFCTLLKLNKLEDDDITLLIFKPQNLAPLVI